MRQELCQCELLKNHRCQALIQQRGYRDLGRHRGPVFHPVEMRQMLHQILQPTCGHRMKVGQYLVHRFGRQNR